MKRKLLLGATALGVIAALSYAGYAYRDKIRDNGAALVQSLPSVESSVARIDAGIDRRLRSVSDISEEAMDRLERSGQHVMTRMRGMEINARQAAQDAKTLTSAFFSQIRAAAGEKMDNILASALSVLDVEEDPHTGKVKSAARDALPPGFVYASYDMAAPPPPLTLTEIRRRKEEKDAARMNGIVPAAAPSLAPSQWTPEQNDLSVEAVLVPRQVTVISSSQDGRIASVPVNHGDSFKKGDVLVAYDCGGLKAEAEIARVERDLTLRKAEGSDKLFKLDIISDIDRLGAQVQDRQAAAKSKFYDARLQDCEIRAEFDGRVTNRLANPGEYTRTDRVLLEVASNEPLQAEFLIPSKWLRWVNVGAPLSITVAETEKTYTARVLRIHGEVDPVSQSIQVIATLDGYDDPLLPGMSGKATIEVQKIRDAGVRGYLEATPVSYRAP